MRRLVPRTRVELLVGDWAAPATVVATSRDGVRLRLVGAGWPAAASDLLPARVVTTGRHVRIIALDGLAQRLDGDEVRWFPAHAALSSRRGTARLRIALDATVHGRRSTTIDLSATGALLRCPPGPVPIEVDVTIDVAGRRIAVRAAIVRALPDGIAVRFLDLDGDDRARIAAVVDVIALRVAATA